LGLRGPHPNRPQARILVLEAGNPEPKMLTSFDGLDPDTCLQFELAAIELGWTPGRLLDQQMRSFLARRNSEHNRT
jgi:hypothetical protein